MYCIVVLYGGGKERGTVSRLVRVWILVGDLVVADRWCRSVLDYRNMRDNPDCALEWRKRPVKKVSPREILPKMKLS